MATKTINFNVDVRNVKIVSGTYDVQGIVSPYSGSASGKCPLNGNTFSAVLKEGESEYFAVTVSIEKYEIGGIAYSVTDKPLCLMATLYLPDTDYTVNVCPESSVASIYTFARMAIVKDDGLVRMNATTRSLKIAYGMKQNIYKTEGVVADMIKNSPNGFETNSYPMFNSLCNLFYYCMENPELSTGKRFYDQFLDYAWHKADEPNMNFLQAVKNILHDPFYSAKDIYNLLVGRPEIYADSLISMTNVTEEEKIPNNWTLTLKTNLSGSKNFIPSGLAFVVFDADDNAWVANNFRAGAGDSGTHCLVYKYDATPADFSPVQGGGLLGVAFGAAIDPDKEYISFGNFGWGSEYNNPQEGSISRFYYKDGRPVTPPNGYILGLSRVQGMQYDASGNLWMASVGCQEPFAPAPVGVYPFTSEPSAVVVYLKGDPEVAPTAATTLILDEFPVKKTFDSAPQNIRTPYLKIFDVVPDNKGNAYVSCIGNYDKESPDNCALSSVYKVAIEGNKLVLKAAWYSDYINTRNGQKGFESLRQVAINPDGDVVVVGVTGSRATVLNGSDLTPKKPGGLYYDTNTNAPWGVKIDKRGDVYLANFGEEKESAGDDTLDMIGPFGVTLLRDPSDPTTAKLLTVPSGGAEVMLANGCPLYGTQTRPVEGKMEPVRLYCYEPIMRLTSTNIDGAGNLWCMNNWKPSAAVDVADNPGGDGAVIFLGIAEPE